MKLYIAGPMRGIPEFNFPAFDAARDRLIARGFEVISPADMDRENGFDGAAMQGTDEEFSLDRMKEAIIRDVKAVTECDGLYLLRGWERSRGVAVELAVARFVGGVVYYEEYND